MIVEEYDEKTCITAGELRNMGVNVPKDIPDYGWIPRYALRFTGPMEAFPGKEPGSIRVNIGTKITEPFRWVRVDLELEGKES